MKQWACVPLVVAVLVMSAPATPQGYSRYDMLGPAVEVTIADLVNGMGSYSGRAIRTKGFLELSAMSGGRSMRLRDSFSNFVRIVPVPDIAGEFDFEVTTLLGQQIEVTGVFEESQDGAIAGDARERFAILFWKFLVLPDPEKERLSRAKKISIQELASRPGRHDGRTVRVVGVFRGHNLFGDLPAKSQRKRGDWVLQHGEHAIWVTGQKPKGDGWQFDAALKRDTGKWLEVTGKLESRNQITYIRAERLVLTGAPAEDVLKAEATPPPPDRPRKPPVVVFALPLDGEAEVPGDSRFIVQFSKDMDESSFKGHVELRYLSARAGVRPLESVSITYEPGRNALTVDPGDQLGLGMEVELRLLPGIKDIEGLELVPRNGRAPDGVIDILRYRVGT
jgi:hypothetical protein